MYVVIDYTMLPGVVKRSVRMRQEFHRCLWLIRNCSGSEPASLTDEIVTIALARAAPTRAGAAVGRTPRWHVGVSVHSTTHRHCTEHRRRLHRPLIERAVVERRLVFLETIPDQYVSRHENSKTHVQSLQQIRFE